MEKINESVKNLWESYLNKNPEVNPDTQYTSWYFCDNKKDADELAELVLNGEKTATSSIDEAYEPHEKKPEINDYSVVTNFHGEAKCIIKTIEIKKMPFGDVTEEMAYHEGEGDRSLEYWKRAHIKFFSRYYKSVGKKFNDEALVIYERFKVVYKNND